MHFDFMILKFKYLQSHENKIILLFIFGKLEDKRASINNFNSVDM